MALDRGWTKRLEKSIAHIGEAVHRTTVKTKHRKTGPKFPALALSCIQAELQPQWSMLVVAPCLVSWLLLWLNSLSDPDCDTTQCENTQSGWVLVQGMVYLAKPFTETFDDYNFSQWRWTAMYWLYINWINLLQSLNIADMKNAKSKCIHMYVCM